MSETKKKPVTKKKLSKKIDALKDKKTKIKERKKKAVKKLDGLMSKTGKRTKKQEARQKVDKLNLKEQRVLQSLEELKYALKTLISKKKTAVEVMKPEKKKTAVEEKEPEKKKTAVEEKEPEKKKALTASKTRKAPMKESATLITPVD